MFYKINNKSCSDEFYFAVKGFCNKKHFFFKNSLETLLNYFFWLNYYIKKNPPVKSRYGDRGKWRGNKTESKVVVGGIFEFRRWTMETVVGKIVATV